MAKKRIKLKSSLREKRRYLLVKGSVKETDVLLLRKLGVFGYARAAPIFIIESSGKSVISVARKEEQKIREILGKNCLLVSGTLKKIKGKL